jgi:hypothetical protein
MSNVTAALPRKSLTSVECKFLKVGNRMLLEQNNGRIASAALMDITEGNAKNKHADKLLRDLFGLDTDPTPRRAA